MSDHSISIVCRKSAYHGNEAKAKEILQWLISKDIVKRELSNCILSADKGYAISDGAKQIVSFPDELPYFLISNGLDVITSRQIFDTGETGIEECICPNCKKDIAKEDWDFFNNWYEVNDDLICPFCNIAADIHQFKFTPEWGFSDLGFTFWNWPEFEDSFISEFKEKLNCDVSVVYQHI